MTPTEAKIELNNLLAEHPYRSLDSARTRKAIKTAIAALNKQTPRKPYPEDGFAGSCPNCNAVFLDNSTNYCGNCGQALDWEDSE